CELRSTPTPAQSKKSVPLRSTTTFWPGAIPSSVARSRGAVAQSRSPATATVARPSHTFVLTSNGITFSPPTPDVLHEPPPAPSASRGHETPDTVGEPGP